MAIKIKGFDELQKTLNKLQRNARALDGEHHVNFEELFKTQFMQRNTRFSTFSALIEASNWSVESQEDFEAIPEDEWDVFIRETTRFPNWKEMVAVAAREYAEERLFRGVR